MSSPVCRPIPLQSHRFSLPPRDRPMKRDEEKYRLILYATGTCNSWWSERYSNIVCSPRFCFKVKRLSTNDSLAYRVIFHGKGDDRSCPVLVIHRCSTAGLSQCAAASFHWILPPWFSITFSSRPRRFETCLLLHWTDLHGYLEFSRTKTRAVRDLPMDPRSLWLFSSTKFRLEKLRATQSFAQRLLHQNWPIHPWQRTLLEYSSGEFTRFHQWWLSTATSATPSEKQYGSSWTWRGSGGWRWGWRGRRIDRSRVALYINTVSFRREPEKFQSNLCALVVYQRFHSSRCIITIAIQPIRSSATLADHLHTPVEIHPSKSLCDENVVSTWTVF